MKNRKVFTVGIVLLVSLVVAFTSFFYLKDKKVSNSGSGIKNPSQVNRPGDSSSNDVSNSNPSEDENSSSNGELENPDSNITEPDVPSNSNNPSNSNSNKNPSNPSNSNKNPSNPSNPNSNSNSGSNVTKPLTVAETVDKKLSEMTLDEKIGQMLIISITGTSMTNSTKNQLTQYKPGGVILFANNLGNYQTTINFVDNIQGTNNIPLFISIDQEGGKVQRLTSITGKRATTIPAMLNLGKTQDTNLAYSVGTVIGEELRVFGINMDFAPVIDVLASEDAAYIGNRSFGTDANLVSNMGIALGNGLQDTGVIPVYKHFPGHGSTITDSHYDLPVITKTKAELYGVDLIPFQKAIRSGAKVIMIGHLAIPNITKDNTPASLSKELITNILKKEMGYGGLVITDALNMKAITNNYTEKQIYELAINAGVDILLMPKSASSAISYIKQSIQEGKIKESQIDASVRKILTLKYTNLKTEKFSSNLLGSSKHQQIISKINQ